MPAYAKLLFMLLILKDFKKVLSFLVFVIARLDRAIQRKELDYPVKPDNDNHWNRRLHV